MFFSSILACHEMVVLEFQGGRHQVSGDNNHGKQYDIYDENEVALNVVGAANAVIDAHTVLSFANDEVQSHPSNVAHALYLNVFGNVF